MHTDCDNSGSTVRVRKLALGIFSMNDRLPSLRLDAGVFFDDLRDQRLLHIPTGKS